MTQADLAAIDRVAFLVCAAIYVWIAILCLNTARRLATTRKENMQKDLIAAARKLIDAVEFDVNGTHGKGGNGGLVSDDTIRAAAALRVLLSRANG